MIRLRRVSSNVAQTRPRIVQRCHVPVIMRSMRKRGAGRQARKGRGKEALHSLSLSGIVAELAFDRFLHNFTVANCVRDTD